jgi:hypothetical protein
MLTDDDKLFMKYWEENRLRKKKIWKQLSVGMPLGALVGGGMLVNIYSGWNVSSTALQFNGPMMIIVMAAVLLTVIFIVIFSAKHRWDLNEQHYKELVAKKAKASTESKQ